MRHLEEGVALRMDNDFREKTERVQSELVSKSGGSDMYNCEESEAHENGQCNVTEEQEGRGKLQPDLIEPVLVKLENEENTSNT